MCLVASTDHRGSVGEFTPSIPACVVCVDVYFVVYTQLYFTHTVHTHTAYREVHKNTCT